MLLRQKFREFGRLQNTKDVFKNSKSRHLFYSYTDDFCSLLLFVEAIAYLLGKTILEGVEVFFIGDCGDRLVDVVFPGPFEDGFVDAGFNVGFTGFRTGVGRWERAGRGRRGGTV